MNEVIQFNYLHRDSGNWKKFGNKEFSNPDQLSIDEIEKKIRENLIDQQYFYPNQVGIKKFKFHRYQDDYSWYEFDSVKIVKCWPITKSHLRSIDEFISLLVEKSNMEILIMGDQPTLCPFCGTRTEICNESTQIQFHQCPNCRFMFLVEDYD